MLSATISLIVYAFLMIAGAAFGAYHNDKFLMLAGTIPGAIGYAGVMLWLLSPEGINAGEVHAHAARMRQRQARKDATLARVYVWDDIHARN